MAEWEFLGTTSAAIDSDELPLFKQYAFDFDEMKFKRDGNGKMILLEGNEALKVWLVKMLLTSRFNFLAYSWQYGCRVYDYINKVMSFGERKSELRRELIESIMTNPYIVSIDSMEFAESERNRELTIEIELTTVYGKLAI